MYENRLSRVLYKPDYVVNKASISFRNLEETDKPTAKYSLYHNRILYEERLGVIDKEFKDYVEKAEEAASARPRLNVS